MANTKNEDLSERGRRVSKPSPFMKLIFQVWSNIYDKETNPDGIVSLGVAENNLLQPELAEFFSKVPIKPFDLTYGDGAVGSKILRESVAKFMNKHFKPLEPIKHEEICIIGGASVCVDSLGFVLANPGEGVLLGKPYYGGFVGDLVTKAEVKPIPVSMMEIDPLGPECVKRYEEELLKSEEAGVRVRALILCNPHNPLGKCYPVETIKAVMRFCKKYSIHLISDEIYALTKYECSDPAANPFVSVLSIPPEMPTSHIHVVYGASKDFSLNGLRLGVIHSRNKDVLGGCMSVSIFAKVSGASDRLWYTLLEDEKYLDWYFEENSKRLSLGRDKSVEWLERNNVHYVKGSNAGYFIWCDFRAFLPPASEAFASDVERERALTQAMIDNGIYLATGESFGGEEPGYYRLTFSAPMELLELGLSRLEKVINKFKSPDAYAELDMEKLAV